MSKTSNAKAPMHKKNEVKEGAMRIYLRLKEGLALRLVDGFPIILGLGVTVILMVLIGNLLG
jgi:hypothetical protein